MHPLSNMAQKMLHARNTASPSSSMMKVKSAPPVKAAAAMPNRNGADLMDPIDSSMTPDGTSAPKRKGSIKAARAPQADSVSDDIAPPAFADGGPVDSDSAGAPSGFKGPKDRSVRGGNTPKAPAFQPTEAMRELPQEVKPPPFSAAGADAPAGGDPFSQLEQDMPKGDGTGPSPFAEAAPAAEAALPGAAAIIKRWGPAGAAMALPALAHLAGQGAENQLDKRTQGAMDDAGAQQGMATTQQLQAQKYLNGQTGANDPAGMNAMAQHGSDADQAIALEFMRHLKKNPAGPR